VHPAMKAESLERVADLFQQTAYRLLS